MKNGSWKTEIRTKKKHFFISLKHFFLNFFFKKTLVIYREKSRDVLNLQTIIRHIANLILWHAATVAADKLARQTRAVGRFIRLVLTLGNSVAPMKDDVNWTTLSVRTVTKHRKIPNHYNWTILTRRSIETCRVRRHTSNSPHCRLFELNHKKRQF